MRCHAADSAAMTGPRLLIMKKKTRTRKDSPTAASRRRCVFQRPPGACASLGTSQAETPACGASATAGAAVTMGGALAVTAAYMLGFASVATARTAESMAGAATGPAASVWASAEALPDRASASSSARDRVCVIWSNVRPTQCRGAASVRCASRWEENCI